MFPHCDKPGWQVPGMQLEFLAGYKLLHVGVVATVDLPWSIAAVGVEASMLLDRRSALGKRRKKV